MITFPFLNRILAALALLPLFGIGASACECRDRIKQPVSEIVASNDAIFIGRVESGHIHRISTAPSRGDYREFVLISSDVIKGSFDSNEIAVATDMYSGMCGMDFVIGQMYLVRAKWISGRLYTSTCSTSYWGLNGAHLAHEIGELREFIKKNGIPLDKELNFNDQRK